MKEELQGKMVEILSSIHTAAGRASDFALEQLPEIAQSYVMYGRVTSLIELSVSLVGIVLGVVSMYFVYKHIKKHGGITECDPGVLIMGSAASFFLTVFSTGSAVALSKSAALVWLAPKVWLLKEIATLIK